MKNVFWMLLSIIVLVSCSDSKENEIDTFPIKDLKLPVLAEGEIFKPNQEIIILGKGFTEESEIWFNQAILTKNEAGAVKAEVVSVDKAEIKILAPAVYDNQDLSLKHEGQYFPLGSLLFAPEPHVMPVKEFTLAKSESDFFKASFQYEETKLTEIKMSYPFFTKVKELTVSISYDGDKMTKLITKDGNRVMSDATVTYKSATEVVVNNIESKAYTYKLNEKGLIVARTDSRNDAKLGFVYDEKGNMTEYTLTYYGNKPEVTNFTYDENNGLFAGIEMPSWVWNYVLTDVVSSDIYRESMISTNNALTAGKQNISYEYNESKQPKTISLNGAVASEVVYYN